MDWSAVNHIADEVLGTIGIGVLIARQFRWRSAEVNRLLRLPIAILVVGAIYLAVELRDGIRWTAGDWFVVGEFVTVAITGTAMGYVTRFRVHRGRLHYALTTSGLVLWLLFIGIRMGTFILAAVFGADLGTATGVILLSFGVNRLAASLIVRRRVLREHGVALSDAATESRTGYSPPAGSRRGRSRSLRRGHSGY